jgi:hypothetical protein
MAEIFSAKFNKHVVIIAYALLYFNLGFGQVVAVGAGSVKSGINLICA